MAGWICLAIFLLFALMATCPWEFLFRRRK